MNNISIALGVMNRTDRIVKCLSSWCSYDVFDDIVIVDWSSSTPIMQNDEVKAFVSSVNNISIIRVDNKQYFSQSSAYNIAVDNCKNKHILKLDIDHILINKNLPNLFNDLIPSLSSKFYCCEHVTVEHWGICFFDKDAFYQVGKYNEKLSGWGYDDQDFYHRLSKIREKNIMRQIPHLIYHNPHGDDLRVANYKIKDKFESNRRNELISKGLIDYQE